MSYSANTTGIARIEVNTPTEVEVTQRVHSVGGGVAWQVHNNTDSPVKVCVVNFMLQPSGGAGASNPNPSIDFLTQHDACSDNLQPGKRGIIGAFFQNATPGQVYTYDVQVNGTIAADPELEI
jgi:hypothetical protein